ncbi:MAG: hypothetical protein J7L54_02830 [Elusimicrobia bacterium]|nr:hypothetical protein [Elusimicrobiota bacterium]
MKLLKKITVRTVPVYFAAIWLLYSARPRNIYFLIFGVALVVIGEIFRIWGCGYLVKTKEFIVFGPYSHLRHPLYLGSYLIGAGFCIMSEIWWMLFLWQAVFALYYYPRKEVIESFRLADIYGEKVFDYMRNVPGLLPRIKGYKKSGAKWSFRKLIKNSEVGIIILDLAGIAIMYLKFVR